MRVVPAGQPSAVREKLALDVLACMEGERGGGGGEEGEENIIYSSDTKKKKKKKKEGCAEMCMYR